MKESTVGKLMGSWFLIVGIITLLFGIGMFWVSLSAASTLAVFATMTGFGMLSTMLNMFFFFSILTIVLGLLAIIISIGLFTIHD